MLRGPVVCQEGYRSSLAVLFPVQLPTGGAESLQKECRSAQGIFLLTAVHCTGMARCAVHRTSRFNRPNAMASSWTNDHFETKIVFIMNETGATARISSRRGPGRRADFVSHLKTRMGRQGGNLMRGQYCRSMTVCTDNIKNMGRSLCAENRACAGWPFECIRVHRQSPFHRLLRPTW